jgi:superfamily II DNA/RNA helicase
VSNTTFAELGLPSELVEALERKLISEPFDIQSLTIPDALAGLDILGRAPTGSGKTLAFGLPMLANLAQGRKKAPRGLVLSPTRELADQICRELEPLAKAMDRSVLAVYGGVGLNPQIKKLRAGVDLLVACPGRLIDLINQGAVRLDEVDSVVVDEADRMADMGFLPDVKQLLDQTSDDRQTVLFSATLDKEVKVLVDRYQNDPVTHEVGEVEPDLSLMEHRFIKVKKTERTWLAADVIQDAGPTVVFVRTRHGVDRLARQLKNEGIRAGYIHGGRSQSQRDRALQVFIDGKVDALVATDVAARGIHVDGVACVIHYDPPADLKDYVHRSGRTARAGAAGTVVSFLDGPQVKESQRMQRKLGIDSEVEPVPPRKPRSSRPETVDDRHSEAPKRRRNTGENKKPKADSSKPPRSSKPRKSSNSPKPEAKRDSGKPRQRSADSEEFARSDRPRRKAGERNGSRAGGNRAAAKAGRGEDRADSPSRRSNAGSTDGRPTRKKATGRPGAKAEKPRSPGKAVARGSSGSKPGSKARSGGPSRPGAKAGAGGRAGASTGGGASGRPKAGGKAKAGVKAKTGVKAKSAVKPKSKRSGKPRPKNRKNKSKVAGGRA